MTNIDYRKILRSNLAKHLNGKENLEKRQKVMEQLNKTDNAIKSWCAPNSNSVPSADDLPVICKILGISLNQIFDINEDRVVTESELKYLIAIEKNPELKAILDKYTESN